MTEALTRHGFRLETELTAESNCHRFCIYAIDENFGDTTSSWKCRISLNMPMLLANQDVFPDNDFTGDDYDQEKMTHVKDAAVLGTVGRIVRSDFFRLTPFTPADFGPAGMDSSWKEWKLYLSAVQGPVASTAWRYDTLCEPRFKIPEVEADKGTEEVKDGKGAKSKEDQDGGKGGSNIEDKDGKKQEVRK